MTMRSKTFSKAVDKPVVTSIRDSRFAAPRRIVINPEKTNVFTYMDPGRGPNGEHQT